MLGISDTKLGTNENGICNIEGYNWESKAECPRINVLVNNSLQYRRRQDLEADGIACIFIELSPANKNPILVANVYREWQREGEPRSENEGPQFERWKKFIEKLKAVAASNQEFHCYGDFNLDRNKWRQIREDDEDESEDEGYASD